MKQYITNFEPWSKTYCFRMDKYDCYLRYKWKCSLSACRILKVENEMFTHNSKYFCAALAKKILLNGFRETADNVCVHRKCCNHYVISQGQHRICICARLKIPMKVEYWEDDDLCRICNGNKKLFRNRQSRFLTNNEFLLKL